MCERCWGNGVVESARSVTVEVPPGVTGGTPPPHRAWGRRASWRPAGDLYVELVVSPHADFVRDGDDLVHRLRIDMVEAALGSEAKVPLIDGGELLAILPGTQPGAVLRIGGRERHGWGSRRGDLIVRVDVAVPKNLSEEEEEALRAYAEARGRHVSSPSAGSGAAVPDPRQSRPLCVSAPRGNVRSSVEAMAEAMTAFDEGEPSCTTSRSVAGCELFASRRVSPSRGRGEERTGVQGLSARRLREGERSLSLPRLQRLAAFYGVPVDQLPTRRPLGRGTAAALGQRWDHHRPVAPRGVGAPTELLERFVKTIQLMRQDFNGRVLTIRRGDLRLISGLMAKSEEQVTEMLADLGLIAAD